MMFYKALVGLITDHGGAAFLNAVSVTRRHAVLFGCVVLTLYTRSVLNTHENSDLSYESELVDSPIVVARYQDNYLISRL